MTLRWLADFLIRDLKVEDYPLIAITGGGGKTSLMFELARLLKKKGRVVATTTAKIAVPPGNWRGEFFIGSADAAMKKIASLPRCASAVTAKERKGDKLHGFTPSEIDEMHISGVADRIIVEADGSRKLPFKAYEAWEPPVPRLTALHFVVAGADVFIKPFGEDVAFRAPLLEERFGVRRGEILSVGEAAKILSSVNEYLKNSPEQARRVLFINKAELLDEAEREAVFAGLSEVRGYEVLLCASVLKGEVYFVKEFGITRPHVIKTA